MFTLEWGVSEHFGSPLANKLCLIVISGASGKSFFFSSSFLPFFFFLGVCVCGGGGGDNICVQRPPMSPNGTLERFLINIYSLSGGGRQIRLDLAVGCERCPSGWVVLPLWLFR